ncbi:MAG: hypothetical protein IJN46_01970 [Lachnospiraceae bacterium]|nr:hypothetical protein [Lachnospiraceae bacterium]
MYHNNNSEKHCISARRLRRIRSQKARKLLVCLTALLCMAFVGSTIAFLVTQTGQVTNTFQGSKVACAVIEYVNGSANDSTESGLVTDVTLKEKVQIKNTGDTQSYIRAKIVITWMSKDGKSVTATKPVEDTDYTIIYAGKNGDTNTAWKLAADGYWYYTTPVNAGDITTNYLIHSCPLKDGAVVPDGYYLSVEIVASAIQSTPTSVVTTQWASGVESVTDVNGTPTLKIKPAN